MTTDIQYTTGRRKEPVSGITETVPREFDRAWISEDITLTLNGEGVTIGKSLKTDLIAAKLFLKFPGKKTMKFSTIGFSEATKKCCYWGKISCGPFQKQPKRMLHEVFFLLL